MCGSTVAVTRRSQTSALSISQRRLVAIDFNMMRVLSEHIFQLLPTVLKSAVQSTNTVIFVPSSFDFIRVENYLRKHEGISYSVLSEYACYSCAVMEPSSNRSQQIFNKLRHRPLPARILHQQSELPTHQRALPLLQKVCLSCLSIFAPT